MKLLTKSLNAMRTHSFWLPVLAAFFFTCPGAGRAELVDRIVATVNDEVITLADVDAAGQELLQKVSHEATSLAERNNALQQARLNIIHSLINEKLIEQEAEKRKVQVSDEDTRHALARMLQEKGQSSEEFKAQLAGHGSTEEQYLSDLKKQIRVSKLVNMDVRSKILITEEKIAEYYKAHYSQELGADEYYILQIGCLPARDISDEKQADSDALQRAERIRALAVSGGDFKELAKKYSDLPSAADGGDIGIFKKDEMSAEMREAILHLQPGELTSIIKTSSGYQFYKLLANQSGTTIQVVPFDSVREEIQETLYQQEIRSGYDNWITELRNQAFIQILL